MMHFPIPFNRPPAAAEPPAFVRVISRSDVQWNRPVFKAPPLAEPTPLVVTAAGAAEFARSAHLFR